ncbi:unnamed protein product [Rotaria sordida]|uniref:Uncharacterized protein n=1 Tax=Rotaria sordida TaxID=392033 RepID=A0A815UQK2_9BILA|nr:unnamed protein product [Rotaria sordida]
MNRTGAYKWIHTLDDAHSHVNETCLVEMLVLKTQFYVYNAALYQQIHGGASGLPLTIFLAYTYLFFGQYRELVKNFTKKNEFFDRYREQAILIWHGSEYQFYTLFNKSTVRTVHILIATTISIGSTVHFHDLEISYTNKGTLESKVYYDPNIVDTLPNVSNELMENATKQLYAVLYRAVRCCSDVEKFHSELLYIQVSFVTFGFTSEFIHSGIQRFYQQFNILEKFWNLRLNNNEYDHLRRCIIEDVEQQIELKQQCEQAKEHTLFMPCPRLMDEQSTDAFKQCFEYWWNKYYANESSPTNSIQIKWIE